MDKKPPQGNEPGSTSDEPMEFANPVRVGAASSGGSGAAAFDARVTMLQDNRPPATRGPVPLWIAIRNRRFDFNQYAKFINDTFSDKGSGSAGTALPRSRAAEFVLSRAAASDPNASRTPCLNLGRLGHGINAYELLRTATEIFLLLRCGVSIVAGEGDTVVPGAEPDRLSGPIDLATLTRALSDYLGGARLPYIDRVIGQTFGANPTEAAQFGDGLLRSRADCPCFFELIWSYWHEEGMLVQSLNALSMRFQNLRGPGARDPLAQLELNPLRPLSTIFWGYVQDEQHRLSLARRAYEYEHEYGLSLRGKAVPQMRTADRRSKFVEAFHDLLYRCAVFYHEGSNLQFVPDPFPLLNGLKEVHLILSQGAGNQFGDLPFTARVEMLMQQWILARPEIREFLGRRPMVVYDEDWMANADAMKSLMGWSDTSISHFRNLAVFGEQLLLSIRWHVWGAENVSETARDWAILFRPEIQGYIHAYRAATGVDLTAESRSADRGQVPSLFLQRRLEEQRQPAGSP